MSDPSYNKDDHYRREARRVGFRSRASFKLQQINRKFKVVKKGDAVLDLGGHPGGWSQVAANITGPLGHVVAFDLKRIDPLDGVESHIMDVTDPGFPAFALERLRARYPIITPEEEGITGDDITSDGLDSQSRVKHDLLHVEGYSPAMPSIEDDTDDMDEGDDESRFHMPKGFYDAVISDMSPHLSGTYCMDQARSIYLACMSLDLCQPLLRRGGSYIVKVFEGEDFLAFKRAMLGAFHRVSYFAPEASRKKSSELYCIGRGHRSPHKLNAMKEFEEG